eukprot:GHVT01087588.1.p1 GENE.GHVT01087588.1~~GHVT01087588.1.p1  ORF type:complete len:215 (+),score=17.26 GHVT01087588.1:144-788(+)
MGSRERVVRCNVLVTGTPGVGKTTFCQELCEQTGLRHVEVSALIKKERLYSEWDDERDCSIFDDKKLAYVIDDLLQESDHSACDSEGIEEDRHDEETAVTDLPRRKQIFSGHCFDFHSCSFMDPSWIDAVIVLRSDTAVLYDRLEKRNYTHEKIQENVQCEIFQVLLDEARDTFDPEIVRELANDDLSQLEHNIDDATNWIQQILKLQIQDYVA